MSYTVDNMSRFLGTDCTDGQAEQFAEYLISQGWTLSLSGGAYYAYRNDEMMTEQEWAEALWEGPRIFNAG